MVKLGYILSTHRGRTDRIMADMAARLKDSGRSVAGLVQTRAPQADDHPCDMDLIVLPDGPQISIAQELGAASHGCRLDPEALANASELVRQSLAAGADVMILNKFGAQECNGRGFRGAIETALEQGIPVLTAVNEMNLQGFQDFAGGLETRLDPDQDDIFEWLLQPVDA